jgi:hypothetical protein
VAPSFDRKIPKASSRDVARVVLGDFQAASARMVDALKPLAGIGALSAAAHVNADYLTRELAKGVEGAFAEVQGYIAQVSAGIVDIRIEPPTPPPSPPPSPAIERRTVVVLSPSKWTEPDGTVRTVGRLAQAAKRDSVHRAFARARGAEVNSRDVLCKRGDVFGVQFFESHQLARDALDVVPHAVDQPRGGFLGARDQFQRVGLPIAARLGLDEIER